MGWRSRVWWLALVLVTTMTASCSDGAVVGSAGMSPAPAPIASSIPASSSPASSSPISSSPVSSSPVSRSAEPSQIADGLPDVGLAGVNVANCRSNFRPVILLHGTFSTAASNFAAMVPPLLASGRCVYAINYGDGGLSAVTTSAAQFAKFVTVVRASTGVPKVDVIAYSQGGLVLRTGLRLNGGANQVATAVLIAPSWNGTTSSLIGSLPAGLCPACTDQSAGSALLRRLDVGGDLDGSVRYAEISTRADTVVTPVSSQVPSGPADRVRSLVVEDRCPGLVTDHVRLPAVPGVIAWTLAALATDGRPGPSALTC